jgi:hypothetical protein
VRAKPSPAIPARSVLPVAPVAPPPPSPAQVIQAQLAKMPGIWGGNLPRPNIGICALRLELKPGQDNHFTGYSTMSCGPSLIMRPGQLTAQRQASSLMQQMTPVSAILSGAADEKGAIVLKQDQAIGARDGCNITQVSLVPFAENLAASWTEGPGEACEGGQAVMHRVGAL